MKIELQKTTNTFIATVYGDADDAHEYHCVTYQHNDTHVQYSHEIQTQGGRNRLDPLHWTIPMQEGDLLNIKKAVDDTELIYQLINGHLNLIHNNGWHGPKPRLAKTQKLKPVPPPTLP